MASIVVIDSEETVRRVMTEILQKGGHSVRGAREFDDGISLLRSDLPDLVITNVFLRGGITGHEAMRKLKGEFPQLPFLMVSGLPDQQVFRDWAGEPGFDVFPKPFTLQSLLNKVDEMIGKGPKH